MQLFVTVHDSDVINGKWAVVWARVTGAAMRADMELWALREENMLKLHEG